MNATFVFISHFSPNENGHGGEHRTYQIAHEIQRCCGEENFHGIYNVQMSRPETVLANRSIVQRIRRKLSALAFPEIHERKDYWSRGETSELLRPVVAEWLDDVCRITSESSKPVTVVFEHPGFSVVTDQLQALKAIVVCLPQNLETIDALSLDSPLELVHGVVRSGLSEELESLRKMDRRSVISRVEAAMLNSFGIPADVYPYYPVGAIKEGALQIRKSRVVKKRNYVVLGSGSHHTTREGMVWLLKEVRKYGLPRDVRITLVGSGTTEILKCNGGDLPNVRAVGWLTDGELFTLLSSAEYVLAPQFRGMGALTKLSELSLSGIPVFTGLHALYSLDVPPGVVGLEQEWDDWEAVLSGRRHLEAANLLDYENWEGRQSNLESLLSRTISSRKRNEQCAD